MENRQENQFVVSGRQQRAQAQLPVSVCSGAATFRRLMGVVPPPSNDNQHGPLALALTLSVVFALAGLVIWGLLAG